MNGAVCSRAIHRTFQNQTRARNCPTTNGGLTLMINLTCIVVYVNIFHKQRQEGRLYDTDIHV